MCEQGDDVVDGDSVQSFELGRVAAAEHLFNGSQEGLLDRLQPTQSASNTQSYPVSLEPHPTFWGLL